MIASLLLMPLLLVGSDPTTWQPLSGVTGVEYRWARPENNTCRIDLRNQGNDQPIKFTLMTKYVSNRTNPLSTTKNNAPTKGNTTELRKLTDEKTIPVELQRAGRRAEALSDCYEVVEVTARPEDRVRP